MCDCMKVKQEVSDRSPEVSVCGVNVLVGVSVLWKLMHSCAAGIHISSSCRLSVRTVRSGPSRGESVLLFQTSGLLRRQQHTRSNAQTFKNNISFYHCSNLKTMISISPPAFPSHSLQLQPVFTVAVMQDKHPRWSIARSSC